MPEPNFELHYDKMDPEDQALHDSIDQAIDSGELILTPPSPERRKEIQEAARLSILERRQSYEMCLQSHDIEALNKIAEERGMPPEALLSSIVHEFVAGRLVEKN